MHTYLKSSVQLQCDRSPSLLRVRSSDWYQNKAHSLYFHVLKTFFVFKTNFVTKSGQTRLTLDRISDQFHLVFPMWDGTPWRKHQNETSGFEISVSATYSFAKGPQSPAGLNMSSKLDFRTVPGLYNPSPSQKPCVEELTAESVLNFHRWFDPD